MLILRVAQLFLGAILLLVAITHIAVPAAMYPLWVAANETAFVFGVTLADYEVQSVSTGMASFGLVGIAVPIIAVIMVVEYLIMKKRDEEGEMGYSPFAYHEFEHEPIRTGDDWRRSVSTGARKAYRKAYKAIAPKEKTTYFVDGETFEV